MKDRILANLIDTSASTFADVTAVKWLVKKDIFEKSYAELNTLRLKVAHALKDKGYTGANAALIGVSSYEWIASYLGIVSGRMTAVPLDAGLPEEELLVLINRSDAEIVFVSPKLTGLIPAVKEKCPAVREIVVLSMEEEREVLTLGALVKEASSDPLAQEHLPKADDVATIIFTSGTTGISKGVMLTQRNLYDNVDAVAVTVEPGTRLLSVLPIHHAFCLVCDWLKGFQKGATVCINDSFMHMMRNILKFQPRIMLMVPLMIEMIYKKLSAADPAAMKSAVKAAVFGENLEYIYSGGAHLDPMYVDAFAEYGIQVCEGYGMSECSPVISMSSGESRRAGSVGKPLSNVKVRIQDGEVQVQGSSVMKGYYRMPEETAAANEDGWLHTGDRGHIDADGYLFITGRIKNLIILSNGENISPEEIETKLALSNLVGEVIVTGENNGLTARIYPDPDVIAAAGMGEADVKKALQAMLDDYNRSQPTYRAVTGLVVRKYPFIKNSIGKIKRTMVEEDRASET